MYLYICTLQDLRKNQVPHSEQRCSQIQRTGLLRMESFATTTQIDVIYFGNLTEISGYNLY